MVLGKLLFTKYLLPFEVVSLLLLVAMVGVILLSKRNLK
jgi:NADH-quinone oxidoreductase subunit J